MGWIWSGGDFVIYWDDIDGRYFAVGDIDWGRFDQVSIISTVIVGSDTRDFNTEG